jgi:O-antigen/teichoic acid export membrane protein
LRPFNAAGEFKPIDTSGGLRRIAVKSAGITVFGQGVSFFLQLLSTMVLARLLSPNDFGIIAMVTTFILLLRSFGLNGFTELIMQREEITQSLASNFFWIELGIGALLTVGFAASAPAIAHFYHNAAVVRVAQYMSLTIVISCLGWIHLALLQRAMRFTATAIINLVGQAALVIVSVALGFAGWHYWALVCGNIAQVTVVAAGGWMACQWIPSRPRRVAGTESGLKFVTNVYSHFVFSYSTRNTDNLLVGWKYDAKALGLYKKAYDLFVLAEAQLMYPISAVAISALSRVRNDRDQYLRYFLRTISVLALVGMGIGADFALIGRDVIRILLGPGWEEAGRIFTLFGPGIGVMMLYNTHGWVHLSLGRPERWLRWGLIEFACTASLFLLGLHWGPSGIALAWTTSYFLLMIPGFWYAGRPIGLGVTAVLSVIWKFFLASLGASCLTVLIMNTLPRLAVAASISVALFRTLGVSLLFCGLYLLGVILLHRGLKPINETVGLLRDLLPRRRPTSQATGQAI